MGSFTKPPDFTKSVDDFAAKTKGPGLEEIKRDISAVLDKAVTDQLPKEVPTLLGMLPYATFKELFKNVYDQVSDKTHLLSGRVTHTFRLGKMEVTLRSIKNKERIALAPLLSDPKITDQGKAMVDEHTYKTYLLLLSLVKIDTVPFPDVELTPERFSAWKEHEHIVGAINFIGNLDESLFFTLCGLVTDLSTAKHFALVENLRNP